VYVQPWPAPRRSAQLANLDAQMLKRRIVLDLSVSLGASSAALQAPSGYPPRLPPPHRANLSFQASD